VNELVKMAISFAGLSILGFGGGKGIIPQMHLDSVANGWVTSEQFSQFYTIGKLVPGPTTIFSALIGYNVAGVVGAAVATAAMFIPSTGLMMYAGAMWGKFSKSRWKNVVSVGLEPIVIGLIWSSVFSIGKGALHGIPAYVIATIVTGFMLRTKLSAPLLILMGAAGGAIFIH
jgi:chromate transporter